MSEARYWISPEPLPDYRGLTPPDDPDPARSFEIVGPAACRRVGDGASLYLSADEVNILSTLREGVITMTGLSDTLRHATRLAAAGLIEIVSGSQSSSLRLHPQATIADLREQPTSQVFVKGPARTREQLRQALKRDRYILTDDQELGLSPPGSDAVSHIREKYFGKIRVYDGDVPADRKRLTGLLCAHWILGGYVCDEQGGLAQDLPGNLVLSQSPHSTVPDFKSSNIAVRPPEYDWHDIVGDAVLRRLCQEALLLLPKTSRHASTTVGVQLFETASEVVKRPHNDGADLTVLYCLYSDGGDDGAWTYVLAPTERSVSDEVIYDSCPLFAARLQRGQILTLLDNEVGHFSTPNTPRFAGHEPKRGMGVLTVNRPETYLEQLRYPYADFVRRFPDAETIVR